MIGLFIDAAYAWNVTRGHIKYTELRAVIEEATGDKIDEGYFFNADTDPPRAQRLHNALAFPPPSGPGLRVKTYWLAKKPLFWPRSLGGHPVMHPEQEGLQFELTTQKAVDVGLVFHMTRSYYKRKWDKLVLVAGDADFYEPVRHLVENEGVDLYIVGSMSSISDELRPYARKIIEIDREPLFSRLRLERPIAEPA